MSGLFANHQPVDLAIIAAFSIAFIAALFFKAKMLAVMSGGLVVLCTFIVPPSQTKLLDVRDPMERYHTGEKAYSHGGPTGGKHMQSVMIAFGATLLGGFFLFPLLKKKEAKKAEAVDQRVKRFMGNNDIPVWQSSFNTARINAAQGALEMGFRALETAVGAGMDNPEWIDTDPKLAPLRDRNERRFQKLVMKAAKNRDKAAKAAARGR